ncbi:hypothetical protein BGX29_002632 [Mortierella sp. GBA35]|nr:hypothetical protein BGX29_002632 [Mortierella sp. GBA35]
MVPQHDVHITWPHPVPSGNAFIAGTWSVPGHGPWEKLPMTRIPGTDTFEIHLDVQEIEDISDYLDEDGFLHHELLDQPPSHQQGSSPTLTPTSTASTASPASPAKESKRKRISRFFGRARSSSSASTTSTTTTTTTPSSKDLHLDLPYHHQSKDGTFLPLAREYRYQYKFVIDDEWKCDWERPQVQDNHGHWNHELAVELVEHVPQGSSGGLTRSRSSSLQSQHGPQLSEHSPLNNNNKPSIPTTIDTTTSTTTSTSDDTTPTPTTSIIVSPAEDEEVEEKKENEEIKAEVIENIAAEPTITTPVPATSFDAAAPAATVLLTSTTTTRVIAKKPRDTYEAVFLLDETDDLSDGEGRSKHVQVGSDDDSDDDDDDDDNIDDKNNNRATVLLGEDDVVNKTAEVTPQQDDHASLSPADQASEESPVVIAVSAADAGDATTPVSVVEAIVSSDSDDNAVIETVQEHKSIEVVQVVEEDKKKEEEESAAAAPIEDVFVNSSSVAESLPQLDEPSIIVPAAESPVIEESSADEQVTTTPTPIVEEPRAEPEAETEKVTVVERALEAEPAVVSSPAPGSIAIPPSPELSFASATANSHLLSPDVEPVAFVLQAADNGDVSEDEEVKTLSRDIKPAATTTTKTVLEVITDASAIATATAAAAAAVGATVSVTTTGNDYSQVPSPPLTPSNTTSSKRDLDFVTKQSIAIETPSQGQSEQQKEEQQETFERSVYMTPRSESTFVKHTTLEETTATTVEDENATFDILEDKDLPASLLSSSSSSSSLSTLTGSSHANVTSSSKSRKSISSSSLSSREVVENQDGGEDKERKKTIPEQYPNFFWSICKTTAVVSAAVVILGLGLGRKRD